MKKIEVKICGLTRLEDALAAQEMGADYLGFILAKQSKRFIDEEHLAALTAQLPEKAFRVGVFVDETEAEIRRLAVRCRLDVIQLHGSEPPELAEALYRDFPVWKAVAVSGRTNIDEVVDYPCDRLLLDGDKQSGEPCNWSIAQDITRRREAFLAGGLDCGNVLKAIRLVKPCGVDVAGGVELAAGIKDHQKIREFLRIIRTRKK